MNDTLLARIAGKIQHVNALQHAGLTIPPEDWADLHQLTNEAQARTLSVTEQRPDLPIPDARQKLMALKDQGLEFGTCVEVFGVSADSDLYAKYAAENLNRAGEVEIDSTTVLSKGDDPGCYVMAWVWVDDADAGIPELTIEQLQQLGYQVVEDSDQPGKWLWKTANDGADISFESEVVAYAAASTHAMATCELYRCDECDSLHIEQQLRAYTKDLPPPKKTAYDSDGRCPSCHTGACYLITDAKE